MEQRLIDANALIKEICSDCALFLDKTCDGERTSCYPSSIVREQPTVDAVPAVRCKECKYHEDEEIGMVYCPRQIGGWVKTDWFCADGERRTE